MAWGQFRPLSGMTAKQTSWSAHHLSDDAADKAHGRARDRLPAAVPALLRVATAIRGLEAWVWRAVVNAALATRRGRLPRRESAEAVDPASANGHAADEVGVRAWVAALPERQRLTVYLRYYADLDYRSIAQALDVEVGTVSAALSSAHQALRRSLKEVER